MSNARNDAAYLLTLGIENVTCFGKRQEITFTSENGRPEQWTIITGLNGSGKTTLLRAISLLADAEPKNLLKRSGWDTGRQETEKGLALEASLAIGTFLKEKDTVFDSVEIRLTLPGGKGSETAKTTLPLLCAYGPNRLPGQSRDPEKEGSFANETLFRETALLPDPEKWLIRLNRQAEKGEGSTHLFELVKNLLLNVLPDVENIRFEKNGRTAAEPEFKTPSAWLPFDRLSSGHRSVIAWLLDFATTLFHKYPNSENPLAEPAIMLVDEIEQHLHPRWQRRLPKALSRQFPNTQFIVTTNSPLMVQAVPEANLVLLKIKGNATVAKQDIPRIKNWRVDQVLTSDFFGLKSARPRETAKMMRKRDKLLGKPDMTDTDRVMITRLDQKIGPLPYGETGAEIKADSIIKSLASKLKSEGKI